MGVKINVSMIVDYMIEHGLTRQAFCEKCQIDIEDLEYILQYGRASLLTIIIINQATGLNRDKLKFSEPYITKNLD